MRSLIKSLSVILVVGVSVYLIINLPGTIETYRVGRERNAFRHMAWIARHLDTLPSRDLPENISALSSSRGFRRFLEYYAYPEPTIATRDDLTGKPFIYYLTGDKQNRNWYLISPGPDGKVESQGLSLVYYDRATGKGDWIFSNRYTTDFGSTGLFDSGASPGARVGKWRPDPSRHGFLREDDTTHSAASKHGARDKLAEAG